MFNVSETKTLFDAAERDDVETVKFFIEKKGAPIEITNHLDESLAHVAAKNRNLHLVKYVLEKEPSIFEESDRYSHNLLRIAVEKNAVDIVKYLVEERNADISKGNCPDCRTTALHTAIKYGHSNLLKYFIEERKANVNIVDWQDKPLVFYAAKYQRRDMVEYLIEERKANLTMLDRDRENILFSMVRKGDLSLMKYVLDERKTELDVNWRNYGGQTLIHVAIIWNRMTVLTYLVGEKRADINVPDTWHFQTPLHYAASRNLYEICEYLIEHGADTRFPDDRGKIPLHMASDQRLLEYMKAVSANRTRRSITDYPNLLASSPRITKSYERALSKIDEEVFLGNGYLSQFSGFLAIAETIFGSAKVFGYPQQTKFLTPQAMVHGRMDANAVNAVFYGPIQGNGICEKMRTRSSVRKS